MQNPRKSQNWKKLTLLDTSWTQHCCSIFQLRARSWDAIISLNIVQSLNNSRVNSKNGTIDDDGSWIYDPWTSPIHECCLKDIRSLIKEGLHNVLGGGHGYWPPKHDDFTQQHDQRVHTFAPFIQYSYTVDIKLKPLSRIKHHNVSTYIHNVRRYVLFITICIIYVLCVYIYILPPVSPSWLSTFPLVGEAFAWMRPSPRGQVPSCSYFRVLPRLLLGPGILLLDDYNHSIIHNS